MLPTPPRGSDGVLNNSPSSSPEITDVPFDFDRQNCQSIRVVSSGRPINLQSPFRPARVCLFFQSFF